MASRTVAAYLVVLVVVSGGVLLSSGNDGLLLGLAEAIHSDSVCCQDCGSFNLTWTSRTSSSSQLVVNGSFLEGDHIVLNATFLGHSGLVGPFNTSIAVAGEALNAFNLGESVILDTYALARNGTFVIEVSTIDSLDQQVACTYEDVFLGNFFAPLVIVDEPDEMSDQVYNITWTCTDTNQDDIHFSEVWISSDGGVSYNLLANNISVSWYVWNATGFPEYDDQILRIRAYSIDLNLYAGPFLDIPNDYVPGDFGEGFYYPFHNDGVPTWKNIDVSSSPDISYTAGETGNVIQWELSFWGGYSIIGYVLSYTVYLDSVVYVTDSHEILSESNQVLVVSVDGLPLGNHNFTLVFVSPGPDTDLVSDTVFVRVLAPPPNARDLAVYTVIVLWALASILLLVAVVKQKRH